MSFPAASRPAPCRSFAWLVAAALGLAHPARALEVTVGGPHEHGGYVVVEARCADLFGPRVAESLARGMPATLVIHGELWRKRPGWFDRLESSANAEVRIRYEVWRDQYRVERMGSGVLQVGTVDSVATALSRPWALAVGRVGQLQTHSRYYVVVFATLKPLSVEDVAEVEGWLSGEVETKRRAGFGVITELPRSLFDAVRNFAGFGDRRARASSDEFELRDLFPPQR